MPNRFSDSQPPDFSDPNNDGWNRSPQGDGRGSNPASQNDAASRAAWEEQQRQVEAQRQAALEAQRQAALEAQRQAELAAQRQAEQLQAQAMLEAQQPVSDFSGESRNRDRHPRMSRDIVMDSAIIEIGPGGLRIQPTSPVRGYEDPNCPPMHRRPMPDWQYTDPRYPEPRYPNPGYPDPRYQDPRYQDPRYRDHRWDRHYPYQESPFPGRNPNANPDYPYTDPRRPPDPRGIPYPNRRYPLPNPQQPDGRYPYPDQRQPMPDGRYPYPDRRPFPPGRAPYPDAGPEPRPEARPDAPQPPRDRPRPTEPYPWMLDPRAPLELMPMLHPPGWKPGRDVPQPGQPGDPNANKPGDTVPQPGDPNAPKPGDPNAPKPGDTVPQPGDPNANKPGDPNVPKPPEDPNAPKPPEDPNAPKPPEDPNAPKPGDPNAKPPESEAEKLKAKMSSAADEILQKHNDAFTIAQEAMKDQGIIGQTFDAAKNNIGTTGEGKAWYNPGRWWSAAFDSDLGSDAVKKEIDAEGGKIVKLQEAAAKGDEAAFKGLYKEVTGVEFDPAKAEHTPKSSKLVAEFDSSQRAGVDTITDVSAAVVTAVALRGGKGALASNMGRAMGTGAVVGGVSKASLMQVDGRYADLKRDAAIGALWGAGMPLGEAAGAGLSRVVGKKYGMAVTGNFITGRIETMGTGFSRRLLSSAVKSGTSGAVFGGIEAPTRHTIQSINEGKAITASDLLKKSVTGTAFGFVGGTAFGMVFDGVGDAFKSRRPPAMDGPTPTKVNGVDVPTSGATSFDDAAKMSGHDPLEFHTKATKNPYGAVDDVVQLYEKHGVNIKKVDPATGKSTLPEEFDAALNNVQKVDALTADAKTGLREKVKIVKSADEFVQANANEVEASMSKIKADPNYQEVVRLKGEQGGAAAVDQFEQSFRTGFEKDLKTNMAVDRVHNPGLDDAAAFGAQKPKMEEAYKQKAADFFKDMTDPTQRARLNTLVDDIFDKFNPETISKKQVAEILEQVPPGDRDLAVALLADSAGNSSDVILKSRLQALRHEIESVAGSVDGVYTLSPHSSGNMLGYLYRKSNSMSMSMQNIDGLFDSLSKGKNPPNSIMIFDDLSTTPLTQEQKALLAKVPNVYVVDLGAFEKGINVLDTAKGPQAVAEKLSKLVAEARDIAGQNTALVPTGVAREVLSGSVDKAAASIGPNVKVIRLAQNPKISNMPTPEQLSIMEPHDAIHTVWNTPKASKEEIATFLSKYAGEEREIAAKMLAEGAVHNSFGAMMGKAAKVHDQLAGMLQRSGMSVDDLLLVSDKDPGGSTHLISYLFGQANGLSSKNFISARKLDQLITSGGARGKAIAYFDDTVYSGSQAASMLDSNVSSLMPFKKVVIGSLGAYQKGIDKLKGTHLASVGKVEVATASVHQPFYSTKHPFYASLSPQAQSAVKNIGGSSGFGDVQGSLIWSYMYPDNNLDFFGSGFSNKVLHLPGS